MPFDNPPEAEDCDISFLSICSGIEAASEAWEPLGFRPVLYSEIEAWPRELLRQRFGAWDMRRRAPSIANRRPDARLKSIMGGGVPLWGDFTAMRMRHLRRMGVPLPDILVGGTPCQDFSFAGLRKGLAGARGNLTLSYVRLADALENARRALGLPGLALVWENVPGILSDGSNAFGCFLGALSGAGSPLVAPGGRWKRAGYVLGPRRNVAWIIKDAQYFGLAQRRERIVLVACAVDGPDPREILFEPDGLRRDSVPRRETGAGVAALTANGVGASGPDDNQAQAGHLIPDICPTLRAGGNKTGGDRPPGTDVDTAESLIVVDEPLLAHCLSASHTASGRMDPSVDTLIAHTPRGEGFDASEDGTGRGIPLVVGLTPGDRGTSVDQACAGMVIPFDTTQITSHLNFSNPQPGDPCHPLVSTGHPPAVAFAIQERCVSTNVENGPDGKGYQEQLAYTLEARSTPQMVAFSIMPQNSGKDYKARQVEVAQPLMAGGPVGGNQGGDFIVSPIAYHTAGDGCVYEEGDCTAPLTTGTDGSANIVAFNLRGREGGSQPEVADVASLRAASGGSSRSYVGQSTGVRRLMVVECERLQGFPDGHTAITAYTKAGNKSWRAIEADEAEYLAGRGLEVRHEGKTWRTSIAADGPAYKGIGNSKAVPVVAWLGRRLKSSILAHRANRAQSAEGDSPPQRQRLAQPP